MGVAIRLGGSGRHPAARPADISRVGLEVEVVYDEPMRGHGHGMPVKRTWYVCPKCGRRCRHIYVEQMACRICAGLDYAGRHRHPSIPGYNRLLWLRRKIGAEAAPFTPLPTLPAQATRKRKIAAEIGRLEAGLIGHLASINNVLERRIKLRGLK